MSSIPQAYYQHSTPRESKSESSYNQYVSDSTPKKLPGLTTENAPRYLAANSVSNYTYSEADSGAYSSDNESPIKKLASSVTSSGVKLPSFSSLLQSINSEQPQNTNLSFDSPMMNSLNLENPNFKPLVKSVSVQSSPARDGEQNSTFLGIYNYSKTQFEDPNRHEKSTLAAAPVIRREPQSQQQSPLQLQQERFGAIVGQQNQFTFSPMIQQQQHQQISGLHQLAQVIRSNEMMHMKTSTSSEKRFRCKICSRGFNTAGNLSRHKKVHTGEKKYMCQYPGCESKFARSDSCMQHYRTHANENGYTSRRFKRMKTDEDQESSPSPAASVDKMNLDRLMC